MKTTQNNFRKYEEIYPPEVGEFVYITDDTYTKKQVLRMEHLVLKVLNFDLAIPSALTFANLFCKMSESEERTAHLAQYLCELTLMDGETYLVRLLINRTFQRYAFFISGLAVFMPFNIECDT